LNTKNTREKLFETQDLRHKKHKINKKHWRPGLIWRKMSGGILFNSVYSTSCSVLLLNPELGSAGAKTASSKFFRKNRQCTWQSRIVKAAQTRQQNTKIHLHSLTPLPDRAECSLSRMPFPE
jgi:hypothetical protein